VSWWLLVHVDTVGVAMVASLHVLMLSVQNSIDCSIGVAMVASLHVLMLSVQNSIDCSIVVTVV
jgi:hypothetical protein